MQKILVIDDDIDMCLLLQRFLSKNGFEVIVANNGKKGLEILESTEPSLILCDFRLDDMTGSQLLPKIKEIYPKVPVIIITGYSDIKIAIEVMKSGAYDYVTKPLFPDEILLTIRKALSGENVSNVKVEAQPSATPARPAKNLNGKKSPYIFGNTPEFNHILNQIEKVAPTNFSIIIYGESGSGKEVIASEIHRRSHRSDKPFVAIDCGALSKELAGSELFGHEKGAFTGAVNQKQGSFEIANGGTIFLDEIANLSYDVQVSLLRVIQERKMRRVGGVKDIELDVRIIVASNERLWDSAKKGKFREDLYHRFNEFSIELPPLRERKNDIMAFAKHFLEQTNSELGKNVQGFSKEVEDIFKSYVWYGNLRELRNVVKRAALLTDGDVIESKTLPFEITNFSKLQFDYKEDNRKDAPDETAVAPSPAIADADNNAQAAVKPVKPLINEHSLKEASLDVEYEMIIEALKQSDFNKSKAAKLLNIDRKTLYNKMKQYKELNNQ